MALSRRTGQRFQASIWPGFVDAMTGLLLVLMFVLTIFMIVQFVLRETISGQADELEVLSAEVAALADALGLEEQRAESLDTRLNALTATLTSTEEQLERERARVTSLTAERDTLNVERDTLVAERDRQAAELSDAQTRITSFEAQVAACSSNGTARVNASQRWRQSRPICFRIKQRCCLNKMR